MLRVGVRLLCATAASPAAAAPTTTTTSPKPLRVLVLTMVPNGGAMTEALRILGYNPYTFESSIRKGCVLTHPQEWVAVLRRQKPFNREILRVPEERERSGGTAAETAQPPAPPCYFDSLVGPPATAAFESILRECPRSTRVILVEEPDKLAWESEMDMILRPLAARCERSSFMRPESRLHTMLLDMVDMRRTLIGPAEICRGGGRVAPASSAAMAAHNAPLGQQQRMLRLSGALDLFEQHVKEVVPSNRLLVFRLEEGWQPLCDFLQVPVPTTKPLRSSSTTGNGGAGVAADATAVAVAPVVLPFPVSGSSGDIFHFLDQGVQKANRVVLFVVLSAAALGLLFLAAGRDEMMKLFWDMVSFVERDMEPHLAKEREAVEAGKEVSLTTHRALFLSKKSTQRFAEEYGEEGGMWRSLSGVARRFTGKAAEEAPAEKK